jgi:hypothetical protein
VPRESGTVQWLVLSLVLSVLLTVVLNVIVRAVPDLGDRIARSLARLESRTFEDGRRSKHRARVFVPWKAMIIASVVLTILLNLALRIF